MYSAKNIWHKLVNSLAVLSLFVMLLGPITVGRAGFTPAGCDEDTICSM